MTNSLDGEYDYYEGRISRQEVALLLPVGQLVNILPFFFGR